MEQTQPIFENPQMQGFADALKVKEAEEAKKRRIAEQKEQLSQYDQRIAALAEMIEKNQQQDDEFNFTPILVQFLEISLQLKKVMDAQLAMNIALECMGDATKFIDDSMNFTDHIFEQMNEVKYGPFRRIRQKIQMRKSIENTMAGIQSLVSRIENTLDTTTMLSNALSKFTSKLNKSKKRTKKGQSKPSGSGFPLADQYLAKRKNPTSEADSTPPAVGPTTSAPSTSTPSSGGIDDIV